MLYIIVEIDFKTKITSDKKHFKHSN